ncbi:MAG: DHH family phosphoesterase [Hymenobacter sp.]
MLLARPRQVFITAHHKPDADALGSSLAWAGYLKKKGHFVTVVMLHRLPLLPQLDGGQRRGSGVRPAPE